jgi:hypothetical protein
MSRDPSVLRLRQKHSGYDQQDRRELDPLRIIASQSLARAAMGTAAVIAVMSAGGIVLAWLSGRVFPWLVLIQALLVGVFARRWGRGFDWRFGVLGALGGLCGAYLFNFLIAASVAGDELGVSMWTVIFSMSEFTLATYAAEDITPADHIFALFSAVIGAFYARRQLSRDEYRALRLMRQDAAGTES